MVRILLLIALIAGSFAWPSKVQANEPLSPWLYLRAGKLIAPEEKLVEMVAVGDVMLGRSIQPNEATLAGVASLLQAADLVIGNFEGVIAPAGKDAAVLSQTLPGKPYKLVMPSHAGNLLQAAGFDLVSLANNHALDMGNTGLKRTIEELQAAGMGVFGVARAPGEPPEPVFVDLPGIRIALLGFTMIPPPSPAASGPAPAGYDPVQAAAAVRSARQQADIVLVSMHWGIEYRTSSDASQQRAAQALSAAGADLVLGCHPHVPQETVLVPSLGLSLGIENTEDTSQTTESVPDEPRRDAFIAYSLGNFVFDQSIGETQTGMALRVYLDPEGLRAVQALPLHAGPRPRWLVLEDAQAILARLQPPAQRLSFTCSPETCHPGPPATETGAGLFWSEKVDLTGDGKLETVRRLSERVEIEQDGETVWSSPIEWQVLDLATGDPNDDGRSELLISLRKLDQEGVSRSHPFIVGYRRGMYKLLWGGSALSSPISEVEVGDVDGDGVQELVVLEEHPGGTNTVSVWRWHGWGFLLNWRSQPGWYKDLTLAADQARPWPQIIVNQRWAPFASQ